MHSQAFCRSSATGHIPSNARSVRNRLRRLRGLSLRAALSAMAAPVPIAVIAQEPAYLYYEPSDSPMFTAFGGVATIILHIRPRESLAPGQRLGFADTIGTVAPHPRAPTEEMQTALDSARIAYERATYELSAALGKVVLSDSNPNPFLLDAYARALFRVDSLRGESKLAYQRLVAILDGQLPTEEGAVVVDPYFAEAYGKLGALHLDDGDYHAAAFELTRSVVAARSSGAPPDFLVHQFSYLTEAFVERGDSAVARWFAQQTLLLDPANQYVLPYLQRIGPGIDSVLACTSPSPTQPLVGPYAFVRPDSQTPLTCRTSDALTDSYAPCLRIGRVHIGASAENVMATLGAPWQVAPAQPAPAYVHLVHTGAESGGGTYYSIQYEIVDGTPLVGILQLTGRMALLSHSMSCLELGVSSGMVLRQLGEPTSVVPVRAETLRRDVELWRYDPVPLSLEILDGQLYSIRVWRSGDIQAKAREYPYTIRP